MLASSKTVCFIFYTNYVMNEYASLVSHMLTLLLNFLLLRLPPLVSTTVSAPVCVCIACMYVFCFCTHVYAHTHVHAYYVCVGSITFFVR